MVWVVNEHERLSIFTLRHKLKKRNCFYCCSIFHCHSRVWTNVHNSYPKMCLYRPQVCSWVLHLFSPSSTNHWLPSTSWRLCCQITWGRGSWFMQGLLFYFSLHSLMIHVIQFGIIVAKLLWNIYFNLDFVLWLTKCVNYI